ncbi:MAG: MurT ligase domain-containing protein, partial [Rothia sp. (in: high G+C Gram-positive bacteria)]|nr:MurT ligase domain-containing protein [Rothia sp. (in: high G+C Gram-positive bacteria)]
KLHTMFPSDDDMRTAESPVNTAKPVVELPNADVLLKDFAGTHATFTLGQEDASATINLYGVYNIFNAAAAMALTLDVMGDEADKTALMAELANITPAFGRGETLYVNGQTLQLLLVKNPSGFRLSLASADARDYATMITINDQYADGRDVSWLWDVDFHSLQKGGVTMVSGVRAYDMALRLEHEDVPVADINEDLEEALADFIKKSDGKPMRIFCTYTAMLAIRKELSKITDVEEIS